MKVGFTFDGPPIFGINVGKQSVVNSEAIYPSIPSIFQICTHIHPSFQICTSPKMSSHLISSHILLSIQVSKSVNSTLSSHPMSSFTLPSTSFKICTIQHCHLMSHLISFDILTSTHVSKSVQVWKSVQVQKYHLISSLTLPSIQI